MISIRLMEDTPVRVCRDRQQKRTYCVTMPVSAICPTYPIKLVTIKLFLYLYKSSASFFSATLFYFKATVHHNILFHIHQH